MRLLRSLCSHITSFTDDTQSPSSKRLSCYSLHHVFSIVYIWLEEKQKLYTFPPIIKAKSFLYTYYKQIELLYIDPNSHLIYYYTPKSRVFEELFIKTQQSINQTQTFYRSNFSMLLLTKPFRLATFAWLVKNSPLKPSSINYIPHLPLWFSVFIHDCTECQTNNHFPTKPNNISPLLLFF